MTAWKVSKYGVISGPYFSAFGLNGTQISYQPYNKDQNSILILATVTPLIQRENSQLIDFS